MKIDENLPAEVAEAFLEAGHDARTVPQQGLGGFLDPIVMRHCRAEGRCLVTLDTDFGNVRAYPPALLPGVIVLRPRRQDRAAFVRLAKQVIRVSGRRSPRGALWVVQEERIRIRRE